MRTLLMMLLCMPVLVGAKERVAVLQLRNTAQLKQQEVDYLTDLIRGSAVKVLPAAKYLVMTTESILELLPPGTDLAGCIGDCEVETGRKLGATYLVTGDVLRFGHSLRVRLSLYETKTANLMGAQQVRGATLEALEDPIIEQSAALLLKITSGVVPTPQPPIVLDPTRGQTEINLGGEVDFATLVAQAKAAKRRREAVEAQERRRVKAARIEARRRAEAAQIEERRRVEAARERRRFAAEEERRAAAALSEARRRRFEAAKAKVRQQATQDFAALRALIDAPSEEGRTVLQAWLQRYEEAKVTVDGMTETVLVPEVPQVRAALRWPPGGLVAKSTARRPALRYIPAGRFMMGSPSGESGRGGDESQHPVFLSDFWMMQTEVTQAQYHAVTGKSPSKFNYCGKDCPVERVSWWDAVDYANRLSSKEGLGSCYALRDCKGATGDDCGRDRWGRSVDYCLGYRNCRSVKLVPTCTGYRLPTEAQWEYAARAGTTDARYGPLDKVAWYRGNSGGKTQPVGGKAANAWGLEDMLGSVNEWCWDQEGAYPKNPQSDPTGPFWSGHDRVLRGGSWAAGASEARAAYRHRLSPRHRYHVVGLRLVRRPPAP